MVANFVLYQLYDNLACYCRSFFFFEKHVGNFYYADRKLLSSITKLVASQIHNGCPLTIFGGSYKNFANLASLSTTVLPLHLTCEKEAFPKFEVRSRKSSIM